MTQRFADFFIIILSFACCLSRVLVCTDNRPKPRDFRVLLKRFTALHYKGMAPGNLLPETSPDVRNGIRYGPCSSVRAVGSESYQVHPIPVGGLAPQPLITLRVERRTSA